MINCLFSLEQKSDGKANLSKIQVEAVIVCIVKEKFKKLSFNRFTVWSGGGLREPSGIGIENNTLADEPDAEMMNLGDFYIHGC